MCVFTRLEASVWTWTVIFHVPHKPESVRFAKRTRAVCSLKTILRVTNTINTRVLTVLNPLIFKFRTQVCFFLFFFNVTFLFGWHLVKWRNDWCVYTGLKTYLYATYGTRMFFILGIKSSVTSIRTYFLLSNCQVKSA